MSIKVEKISEPLILGEGPHWDDHQNALFFVCIQGKSINKYTPATGEHTKTKLDGRVGFIVPVEGTTDQFVVGVERRFLVVQWDGEDGSPTKVVRELVEVAKDVPTNRLNDGKVDPRGRLFAGTMAMEDPPGTTKDRTGCLYRIDSAGAGAKKVETNIGISNGLAWDLKEKACYYIDSTDRNVRRYDYDVETGQISNMKFIFDVKENNVEGIPDGMTIDTDGNIWVALYEGSAVIKIDPRTGKLLQKVPIPALQVTSATFGGPQLDVLFVTTASVDAKGKQDPPCGSTFMVTGLGVRGYPNLSYRL